MPRLLAPVHRNGRRIIVVQGVVCQVLPAETAKPFRRQKRGEKFPTVTIQIDEEGLAKLVIIWETQPAAPAFDQRLSVSWQYDSTVPKLWEKVWVSYVHVTDPAMLAEGKPLLALSAFGLMKDFPGTSV